MDSGASNTPGSLTLKLEAPQDEVLRPSPLTLMEHSKEKSQTTMRVMMTSQREGAAKPALEMVTVKQMDRDLLVPSTNMTLISSKLISPTGLLSVAAQVLASKTLLASSRSFSPNILDSRGSDRYLGHICTGYTRHP